MLADVIIYSIAVVVDTFVRIALWEFLPEDVKNGDDDRSFVSCLSNG